MFGDWLIMVSVVLFMLWSFYGFEILFEKLDEDMCFYYFGGCN